jgi:ATP-dependent Clp protease protease subunit
LETPYRKDPRALALHRRRLALDERELLERHRAIVLRGEINDPSATAVIAKLLYLEDADSRAPVTIYIDSPGGVVTSSLAITDTMARSGLTIATHCFGWAVGTAAYLLASGASGHRSACESGQIAFAPLWARDAESEATADVARLEEVLVQGLARATGQAADQVRTHFREARHFDVDTAAVYGLIDRVED